ncbi:TetR/AcrR family transcriptional regulator [Streptomyces sp. NPDC059943]|uniref:TetR/AcrR family transcriptional regulator n=1 Tax=Streptomyces sp. NPDC059943 TaxID=3347010 RepID=UPI003646C814
MTHARAPRADAVRNRKRILAAAGKQITAHGPDVGMDEIAAAAGVAVGTLYRHFPTKTDLVAAVVAEYVARVADDAEAAFARVTAGERPLDELTAFLGRVIEASVTDRAVKAAAHALGTEPGDRADEDRAGSAVAALIRAGQGDGDVHPDVTVHDIYLLFSTAPTDQPSSARARWLTLVTPGLTAHARPAEN